MLGRLAALPLAGVLPTPARADTAPPAQRLALGWRGTARPDGSSADRVGIVVADWAAGTLRVVADLPAPGRVHGLLGADDGGVLAVATRPGRWLMQMAADGSVRQRIATGPEEASRDGFAATTLNGHAERSVDGHLLYTTETDPATGQGHLGVREATTLRRLAHWPVPGVDPHQIVRTPDGQLLVAIGGIARDAQGRKTALDRMAPALLQIDPRDGRVTGRWTLPDPRLSIRHLAWSHADDATGHPRRLGVALQAEHDDPVQRRQAPTLAVWDGTTLQLPGADAQAGGYAGDIAPGPADGFVLSAEKTGRGLWWLPDRPTQLVPVAALDEVCALTGWQDDAGAGVLLGARRGLARWHAHQPPRMLAWPAAMVPDNHAVLLPQGPINSHQLFDTNK